jgi:hypothetical protein
MLSFWPIVSQAQLFSANLVVTCQLRSRGFAAVMRILAPLRRQVVSGKDRGRPVAETLSALMNCGLKIMKNRLHSGRILGGYGFGTKFPDAVIEPTSAQTHRNNPIVKYDSSVGYHNSAGNSLPCMP